MALSFSKRPVPKWGRIIFLFLAFLTAGASGVDALEPAFRYIRIENGRVVTCLAVADSLPPELVGYIEKGVPISAEYKLELWRARTGWFDRLVGRAVVECRIRFDPWEKEFTVVQHTPDLTVENILDGKDEAIEMLTSSGPVTFAATDGLGDHYLAGSLIIRTMSFSNFREVESWLKGGVSDVKKPNLDNAPNKVGEFLFNMALKISGLKNYAGDVKSGLFTPGRSTSDTTESK